MANTPSLTTGTNTGTQSSTQSPQTAQQPTSFASQTSAVQPGTATSLLNTSNGVVLQPTQLSTISLSSTATTQTAPTVQPKHHINPVLFGFSLLLFVAALYLFWMTAHSAKNTTN